MPGVYGDHHAAWFGRQRTDALDRLARVLALWIQIHNEPISTLAIGWRQDKTFRMRAGGQIQHHARIALALLAGAQRFQQALARWRDKPGRKARSADIEHDTIRIANLEQLVV